MSQGRDLLSRNCPNCGANLGEAPPGQAIVCRYCGHSFQTPADPNPPPRIIVDRSGPTATRAANRPRAKSRRPVADERLLLALRAGAGRRPCRSFAGGRRRSRTSPRRSSPPPRSPLSCGTRSRDRRFRRRSAAEASRASSGGSASRGDDTLWIAAFEGAKLGQVWKAGPLGTYSQAYQSTFTSVVGRSVVVTDYRANLHVYDLGTGRETRTVKLTDRAKGMCAAPSGKARVWIEMSDEKNVLFDVDAGTLGALGAPRGCPRASRAGTAADG